jgi:hypothetical protein
VTGWLLLYGNAIAVDFSVSGFGTLGYARSDQDFKYLRYIDKDGTFNVDSLAGVQTEVQFNSQWGATIQGVASASRTEDDAYEAKIRWAFLSFRPTNDWLFRAGKLRPPIFIHTQNSEVGVTYDQARLPMEVYSLTPSFDFDGAAVTKTWDLPGAEFNVDAYWGKSKVKFRFFQRDTAREEYFPIKLESKGLVLSYLSDSLLLRGSAHKVDVEGDGRQLVSTFVPTSILAPFPPFPPLPPPVGGTLYLPSGTPDVIDTTVLTVGADWRPGDWRVTAEYARRKLKNTNIGPDTNAGYVTVAHRFGKWTPYVSQAYLRSTSSTRTLYQAVNGTPVPLAVQAPAPFGPGLPANFHRILADQFSVFDQHSTMLGVAYSFTATSKLKLEWMRTKVGFRSALVDGDVSDKAFNVFTASYSVAF